MKILSSTIKTNLVRNMLNTTLRSLCLFGLFALLPLQAKEAKAATPPPPSDPAEDLKQFNVAEGFEVTLFASDPMIAKPIHMNFDKEGRLWVASSSVYPQLKAGEVANDKLIILEDKDGDGKADSSTEFAKGLLIPTAVLPGEGGCYVANSTEILFLKDTDGDGKADSKRVVLSGFGTEDTHHIIHTFRWGPDGAMYFNQSIYIHSHVETPWGTRRLAGSGVWRFRTHTQQLDVYCRGMVNPWGHIFDDWGQQFGSDGAGGQGIHYLVNGFMFASTPDAKRLFQGLNPGSPKYASLERLSGRQLPEDWQGDLLTNDFRAHRVCRFKLSDDGSGYASKQMPDLISTKNPAFRPVDIKMGPDGAIYIADWYNPIINHGEVDFFDPRRDRVHGRIWRVTAKGRPLVARPKLVGAPLPELLDLLKAPEQYTRSMAKRELAERKAEDVVAAVDAWVAKLDAKDPLAEHLRLEALWVKQAAGVPDDALLSRLLTSPDYRARAAALRVLKDWGAPDAKSIARLSTAAKDEHPRVRLEALRAAPVFNTPEAFESVAVVAEKMDRFQEYAFWLTANDMKDAWLPAYEAGKLTFGGSSTQTAAALKAVGAAGAYKNMLAKIAQPEVKASDKAGLIESVGAGGTAEDLQALFALTPKLEPGLCAKVLLTLAKAKSERKLALTLDPKKLGKLLDDNAKTPEVHNACLRSAGVLGGEPFRAMLENTAGGAKDPLEDRSAALAALVDLGGPASIATLKKIGTDESNASVRLNAIAQLARLDLPAAAPLAVEALGKDGAPAEAVTGLYEAFIARDGGKEVLMKALEGKKLSADAVKTGLRIITNADVAFGEALKKAAPEAATKPLTREDIPKLVAEAAASGDPARGELLYRRDDTQCSSCHAIGGAGGQVGPDLVSIGASAPVDYIIESLLEPNVKVKEGYNAVMIITKDGALKTGIVQKQDADGTTIRDAKGELITVPKANVKKMRDVGSLMPNGLLNPLTRAETLDLIRFLSELGRPGPYAASSEPLARRWTVLKEIPAEHAKLPPAELAKNTSLKWCSMFSTVSGSLPAGYAVAKCQVDASAPGKAKLKIKDAAGISLLLDGAPVEAQGEVTLDLPAGQSTLTFVLEAQRQTQPLRVEIGEVEGSPAKPRFLNQ